MPEIAENTPICIYNSGYSSVVKHSILQDVFVLL